MTPSRTPFAGFERLGAGDPLSSDGYAFQDQNPLIADLLAQIGAVLHKHDAHAAMANPTLAATLSVAATGGTLRSSQTIYVQYTLLDGQGGESLPRAVQNVSTPAGYSDPSGAPTSVVSTSAGSMLSSTPLYALSVTDGLGGETALGPSVSVTVPAAAHAEVALSGLSAITNTASGSDTAAGWRLWRSMDGGNDWDLMATGPHSTDTFTDDGTTAGDCSVSPLSVGTTGSRGVLNVTVPGGQPVEAMFFRIYASTDGSFISPCLLGTYPVADLGSAKTYGALSVLAGSPPKVSRSYPGANQIDPDTDIINWPWKQPVANVGALPSSGNTEGDVRETLDTHTLYAWNAGTSTWEPTELGGAAGGDLDGTYPNPTVAKSSSSTFGVYAVTPVTRPAAYAITYPTSSRTLAADAITDPAATGASNTAPYGYTTAAQADAISAAVIELHAELNNVRQVLRQMLTDLQAVGLLQ